MGVMETRSEAYFLCSSETARHGAISARRDIFAYCEVSTRGVIYTPTFVLIDDGREIARLIGYPGEDFFWPILADHLAKLPNGCPK